MHKITLTHEFETSSDHFWEKFMDPDFTRELIMDGLGFARCDVGETQQRGEAQHRSMYVEPKLELPAPVAKLLGPRLGYTETANLNRQAGVWTFELKLSVLADRIRMGGTMTIDPVSDKRVRRITNLWTDVRVFGIGKLVELAAEKNLRDGWDKSAVWLADRFRAHQMSS